MKDEIELTNALNSALADDTILMKGGTYAGDFVSSAKPTAGHPITVKSAPGEWATIDGSLTIDGDYQFWQNIEVKYSGWETRHAQTTTTKNFSVTGTGNICDSLVIHDVREGDFMSAGKGTKMNGCLIYHQGWSWTDRGHGHGAYSQNSTDSPVKTFKDCILFDGFGYGFHIYATSGNIDNYLLDGCTVFNEGSLWSDTRQNNSIMVYCANGSKNITVKNCMTYGVGMVGIANVDGVSILDNYFQDILNTADLTNLVESGNTSGVIGNVVFVRPNEYQNTRAIVTIYNEVEETEVKVDLSNIGGLSAGDTVNVRNVQDYFVDIQSLTLDENKCISVSMTDHTVAAPAKWDAPKTTFPQFGCFVVEK